MMSLKKIGIAFMQSDTPTSADIAMHFLLSEEQSKTIESKLQELFSYDDYKSFSVSENGFDKTLRISLTEDRSILIDFNADKSRLQITEVAGTNIVRKSEAMLEFKTSERFEKSIDRIVESFVHSHENE